jgi:hypothetical protein
MFPQPPEAQVYFDRTLTIRGVNIALRVFPTANTFTFSASRNLTMAEKASFANYMRAEGFMDDPSSPPPEAIEQLH